MMGNYEQLKSAIAAVIKTNGNNEITGALLQQVLIGMTSQIGANMTFKGVATPATQPATPDQNCFYMATERGTYSNFDGQELDGTKLAIFFNSSGAWRSWLMPIVDFTFDNTPTEDSTNPVTSDGIFKALMQHDDIIFFADVNGTKYEVEYVWNPRVQDWDELMSDTPLEINAGKIYIDHISFDMFTSPYVGAWIQLNALQASTYSGTVMTEQTAIAPTGTISKTASGVTKTFNLPAESGTLATASQVAAKQDALVSGTNIKTVNGTSVLGSGNIDTQEIYVIPSAYILQIQTAAGTGENTPTLSAAYADIYNAIRGGKQLVCDLSETDAAPKRYVATECYAASTQVAFTFAPFDTEGSVFKRYQIQTNNNRSIYVASVEEFKGDSAPTASSNNYVTSGGVKTALDTKQDTLVSGTNIKTVNSTSLLGSGDIVIPKGDKGDKGDQGNSGYTGAAGELEVVNNLTDGGATAALSAEMGKYLADQTMQLVVSDNILDPSTIQVGKYITTTGGISGNSGLTSYVYGCTDYIELPLGGLYCNSVSQTAGAALCGVVAFDSNKNFLAYTSPSPAGAFFVNKTESVHSDWAYVRFNLKPNTDNQYMIVKGSTLPSEFIPYFSPYWARIPVSTSEIEDDAVTSEKTDFLPIQTISRNLLDPSKITVGKYRKRQDGTVEAYNQVYMTDFIPIDEDGLYCNHPYGESGTSLCGAVIYNANKEYIRYTSSSSVSGGQNPLVVKYREGDAFVVFNIPTSFPATETYVCKGLYRLPYGYEPYAESNVVSLKNAISTDSILDKAVTIDKTEFFIEESKTGNILDPNSVAHGLALSGITHFEYNIPDYYSSYFIPIDERGLFCNHASTATGELVGALVYDEDKQYITYYSANSSGGSLAIPYVDGYAYVRFSIPESNPVSEVYVCHGTEALPNGYEPFISKKVIDPRYLSFDNITRDDAASIVENAGVYPNEVEVVLPNRFYAVVGDTLQLFYQGLVIAPMPRQYDIYANCSFGRGMSRYFEATPTAAGTKNLTLQVFDQNLHLVGSASCEIKSVITPSNPSSNKNILCIGDSLTDGGTWVCELQRRLKASDGTPQGLGLTNITLVGSKTTTKYGQTAHHYGNSGWGWQDFCTAGRAAFRFHVASAENVALGNVYTNNGYSYTAIEINNIGTGGTDDWTILCSTSARTDTPQSSGTLTLQTGTGGNVAFTSAEADGANLLWDSQEEKISFKKYCTVSAGMSDSDNLDYLLLLLTGNGLPHSETPSDWSTIVGCMKDMFDAVHSDYPACKVKLMAIHFPYIDTFISPSIPQHTYRQLRETAFMNKLYQEIANDDEYSSFVEFVNISGQVDSQYNFPFTAKAVNTRNSSITENYVGNTLHLADSGYLQIADAAYRAMCAALND